MQQSYIKDEKSKDLSYFIKEIGVNQNNHRKAQYKNIILLYTPFSLLSL
jgi:hypothetical protein